MSLARAFRRFARAKSGLAAVEFALIAPLMIVLLLTSIELINALQTNRRVENTAVSIADVISRDTEISDDEMNGLWSAVGALLYPNNEAGVSLRVTSISINSSGAGKVEWSDVCTLTANGDCDGGGGFVALTPNTTVPSSELPATNTAGSSLIRVEINFDYTPILGLFTLDDQRGMHVDKGIIPLDHTAYRRSRLIDPIPRV